MKVFVSTHPFSSTSKLNPFEHKMTSQEIKDSEILIAGTEKITEEVFQNAPKLKLISRVGIGLDGVDFELCKKYGVRVAYTPDAPTMAELCVAMILDLARQITITDKNIRVGKDTWELYYMEKQLVFLEWEELVKV